MKSMKKRFAAAAIMMLMMFAMVLPGHAATLKLSKTKITLTVNQTSTLKVKNNKKHKKVKWNSDKTSVATVSQKGVVKAVKAGKATITAKVGNKKLKCKVIVKNGGKNEFNNEANLVLLPDAVNICPYHVRYENGKVVAECYVINGYKHAIYNVNVHDLVLSTGTDGCFARGSFGVIGNGGSIPAGSYIRWRFIFTGNSVLKANANLTGCLSADASVKNWY